MGYVCLTEIYRGHASEKWYDGGSIFYNQDFRCVYLMYVEETEDWVIYSEEGESVIAEIEWLNKARIEHHHYFWLK